MIPIDRFNEYVKNNQAEITDIAETITGTKVVYKSFIDNWLRDNIRYMRLWIKNNPNKAGKRKNWKRFISNWLKREWQVKHKYIVNPADMTWEEEQRYEQAKKRTTGGGWKNF